MNLKEKLLAKQNELKGLEPMIKEGDAEAIKLAETLTNEIKELEELIVKAKAAEDAIGRIAKPEEKAEETEERPDLSILKHQKGSRSFALKAYNDTQARPVDGDGVTIPVMDYDKRVIDLQQPLVVRSMFGAETISGNALTYYLMGAMEGTFGTIAEGGKKSQVHFTSEQKTVALSKIAGFIKETDELLSDWAFLESAIRGRLTYEFNKAVEEFLVGTLLATSGVQVGQATISFDNILKAKQAVRNETGYAADAILINPTDLEALLLTKDSNLQYLLGGPAYGSYGNGAYAANPRIWGLPVVESNSVTAGQAIVGAFKAGSSVVTKAGEGQRVEVANTDADDFQYNRVTVRIEERLALATRVPAAFCLVGTASSSS